MNLVPIADNILVNVDHIGRVEQVKERGNIILYIWIHGKKYEYEYEEKVPIQEFLNIIERHLSAKVPDRFVG